MVNILLTVVILISLVLSTFFVYYGLKVLRNKRRFLLDDDIEKMCVFYGGTLVISIVSIIVFVAIGNYLFSLLDLVILLFDTLLFGIIAKW